jgi:hypothetical protein
VNFVSLERAVEGSGANKWGDVTGWYLVSPKWLQIKYLWRRENMGTV